MLRRLLVITFLVIVVIGFLGLMEPWEGKEKDIDAYKYLMIIDINGNEYGSEHYNPALGVYITDERYMEKEELVIRKYLARKKGE